MADVFDDFKSGLKALGVQYDRDLRGNTSPFREEIAPAGTEWTQTFDENGKAGSTGYNTYNSSKSKLLKKPDNRFDITSYQWYTNDIERRFKDDYFNQIDVPFAKNANAASKGLKDKIVGAVTDKINGVVDTVSDSVSQIKDSATNLLKGSKKKTKADIAAEEYMNTLNFSNYLRSFPLAKVYEFKPRDTLGVTINALTTMMKAVDTIIDGKGSFSEMGNQILEGVSKFLKDEFKIDIKDSSTFADPITRIHGFPNKMYKNLISGYFTGYYEIPILEYQGFLNSRGSQGWAAQSFMQRFLTETIASTVKDFAGNNIGSGFDIATRPKWTIEGGGEGFPSINLEMYLFNDNLKALFNNLSFIHSYVGGNLWYQDGLIQKCSSLYDVEVPGRFRYYFCTCDVEVNYVGKVRQVSDMWFKTASNNILLNWFGLKSGPNSNDPNLDVLNNVPDAYKVTFKFDSVIPNNYNSYIAYVQQNADDSVGVGKNITSFYEKLAEAVNASTTTKEAIPLASINDQNGVNADGTLRD